MQKKAKHNKISGVQKHSWVKFEGFAALRGLLVSEWTQVLERATRSGTESRQTLGRWSKGV